ncbi:hypothetical protein P43SY_008555 [Pythium insidiosum]|uniref:Crinkler effector protein N-terminal domain-containing protein n=1 Tax=Pythium insidiosum TaxID=114742 RepID=A0AAD5LL42_PYTIN|nr:hypothetical protein P43SY_008555 [Pythium insidiosum]
MEEREVKLSCGVYGEGSVFSVEIKRNADVEALQKAIFDYQRCNERFSFPPSALTLYLARKKEGENDEWMKGDSTLKQLLKRGRQDDSDYVEMIPNWILGEDYLGANFQPGRKEIHNLKVFFMYSWTHDEYVEAIADQTFYDKIVPKLDAASSNEVNADDRFNEEWSEEDKKNHALSLKFYYAGGSCGYDAVHFNKDEGKVIFVQSSFRIIQSLIRIIPSLLQLKQSTV